MIQLEKNTPTDGKMEGWIDPISLGPSGKDPFIGPFQQVQLQ